MTSFFLHVLAMTFMLLDHIGAILFPQHIILRCIGRLAFPIYAFMIVEGFKHTKNFKKYMLRLFCFALLSEIPFNIFVSGHVFDSYHQNVLWTFLIALGCMTLIEQMKEHNFLYSIPIVILGYMLGAICKVDYKGAGVLMVLVFYLFDKKAIQFVLMYVINVHLLNGSQLWFGNIQSLALFSLGLIWLYNGKKGIKSKLFQCLCYAFYPLHMIVLVIIALI